MDSNDLLRSRGGGEIHLDEHGLEVVFAGVHVLLQVLIHPFEDQPQLSVAVHAVLIVERETWTWA